MGTTEGDPADCKFHLDNALREAGWFAKQPQTDHGTKFRFTPFKPEDDKVNPARHSKDSWAVRIRQALPYLYPPVTHKAWPPRGILQRRHNFICVKKYYLAAVVLLSLFGCGGGGTEGGASSSGTSGSSSFNSQPTGSSNQPTQTSPPVFNTRVMELVNKTLSVTPRVENISPLVDPLDNGGRNPRISPNGRYVAFDSNNDNLVAGDANGDVDLFVRDRTARATSLIRVNNGVVTQLGPQIPLADLAWLRLEATSLHSQAVRNKVGAIVELFGVSPDGRYSLFATGSYQAHIYDIQTDTVSDFFPGTNPGILGMAYAPDQSYIQFFTEANNLVPNDTNGVGDTFRYFLSDGHVERISVHADGTQFNDNTLPGTLSADGKWYLFCSYADNIVANAAVKGRGNLYLQDTTTGQYRIVSKGLNGPADGETFFGAMTANGAKVVFTSRAENIVAEDSNRILDTFLYDRVQDRILGRLSLTDRSRQAKGGDGVHQAVGISADGNWVTFSSDADKMIYNITTPPQTNSYVTTGEIPQLFVPKTAHANTNQLTLTGSANVLLAPYSSAAATLMFGQAPTLIHLDLLDGQVHRILEISLFTPEPGVPYQVGTTWELPFENDSVHVQYDEGMVTGGRGSFQRGNSGTITMVTLAPGPGGTTTVGLRFDDFEMVPNNSYAQGTFLFNGTITVNLP